MQTPWPPITNLSPDVANWIQNLQVAFSQGQGFPSRFQMGQVFQTSRAGDPTLQLDIKDDPIGSTYQRTDGGSGTSFYVKEASGAIGWVAK